MAQEKCEVHNFMIEMNAETKQMIHTLTKDQQDQREMIARLSENLLELKRFNESVSSTLKELKEYNKAQDDKTDKNSEFVVRISSVLGFLVIVLPILMYLIKKI